MPWIRLELSNGNGHILVNLDNVETLERSTDDACTYVTHTSNSTIRVKELPQDILDQAYPKPPTREMPTRLPPPPPMHRTSVTRGLVLTPEDVEMCRREGIDLLLAAERKKLGQPIKGPNHD